MTTAAPKATTFPLDRSTALRVANTVIASLVDAERAVVSGAVRAGQGEAFRRVDLVVAPKVRSTRHGMPQWSSEFWQSVRGSPRWTITGNPTDAAVEVWLRSRREPRLHVALHLTTLDQFGARMLLTTGPDPFLARVRELGRDGLLRRGATIAGDHVVRDGRPLSAPEERDAFDELGMCYLDPPQRTHAAAELARTQWRGVE